ncbi:hypothetical protein JNB_17833 [Janibacter sp. HTCC2649]|uniref:HAAS signaling domain-containing protein n=1 Tax=Janibacter sp. HTCC2649 TaxID=313589 RepID=UPI0000670FAE|nr:hypothetical protein [Janibacter sp. HTCC2649]EAP97355.1 hypothetical protein JNB_17833 [Janibacter sp. HTCC2649]
MTSALSHPLVSAYLRDLELLLHGVDPGERAEVLAGVHEHLDASLAPSASDEDVRRSLAELGSPQSVADEAYAGRPAAPPVSPTRVRPSPWTAHAACFLNGAGLAFLAFLTLVSVLSSGFMAPHPAELAFLAFGFVIPWFFLMVLTSMSEVWGSPDKFRSILLYPATVVALAVMALLVGVTGVGALEPVLAVLIIAAAAWVLVRLVRATRS